jgi:hypothetical protein
MKVVDHLLMVAYRPLDLPMALRLVVMKLDLLLVDRLLGRVVALVGLHSK